MEKMFSFFRKSSKKESESNNNNNNGPNNKKNKEKQASPVLNDRESINMCKNNLMTQKPDESALRNPSIASSLPNVEINKISKSEVTTLSDNDNAKLTNEKIMSENNNIKNALPHTISYASVVKKPEDVRETRNVKPCGHGTVAIQPRVPITGTKRENSGTPPSSPVSENKKLFRVKNDTCDTSSAAGSVAKLPKIGEGEEVKNVVTASMKLHLNLPASASLTALSESIENSPVLNGEDIEKKNLINQEAKFQSQLNDLSKQLSIRDAEANKLRFQMDELQRDVFAKSAGMDRLQAELEAAHKESEIVRLRIKHLEQDLTLYKQKNSQLSEDIVEKTENHITYENEATAKIAELEAIVKKLEAKIEQLESQLEMLRQDKEKLEQQQLLLIADKAEEKRKLAQAIEQATQQKQEIDKKWKEDFEKLRTINILKEQQLLDDFEWKLREVQQTCKKRLQDKDKSIEEKLQDAYRNAQHKMKQAEDLMHQVEDLKTYEVEIEKLRGLTTDQEKMLKDMSTQQEYLRNAEINLKNETRKLRNMIELEKENLQHMQRRHHQEIMDKERELKNTLIQKRTEIAMYWEERLMHECGRLKMELEQIHNEEKYFAMETVRREKDEEIEKYKKEWEDKVKNCLKEIASLKKALNEKDLYYREEVIRTQTNTDRDIMELRRLMDKIDMTHHEKFEKLVQEHDQELERISEETEERIRDIESSWQNQVTSLRSTVELVKDQMEKESQQKIETLIEQHRAELDTQWENLIHQKSEAVQLVEEEYVLKYKTLEEQFYTQQKSHGLREIELLKTIDSLKNELSSKNSTIDDLQSNVDTLEGGVQVLNQEIASQGDQFLKNKRESDHKIKGLQEVIQKMQNQQEDEREQFRLKLMNVQKQSQENMDHLQRKCTCLTKLFEEVRQRYERRESRMEDLNIISDLKQVIAEQEKDLACLNEEKRYFQMRLINLEKQLEDNASGDGSEDTFEDAEAKAIVEFPDDDEDENNRNGYPPAYSSAQMSGNHAMFSIPPTIPECDDCDE